MTTTASIRRRPAPRLDPRILTLPVGGVTALVGAALLRRIASGTPLLPSHHSVWLALHLAAVIPALPLGGYILWRRKGDRLHRMLGRAWAGLMLLTAFSSFALHGMTGRLSWIHILSVVVCVTVPRGIVQAIRGDIARHQRSMTLTYAGLVTAGLFTFAPGRLLGAWLFG